MPDNNKIILRDVLYVPSHLVGSEVREAFTYRFKNKINERVSGSRVCQNCKWWNTPWYKDKEDCADLGYQTVCTDFEYQVLSRVEEEIITTYKQISPDVVTFGRGNLDKIEKYFGEFEIDDQRSAPELGYPLMCKTKLYPDQQRCVEEFLNKGFGIIHGPVGYGKTVLLCWLLAKIGLRTIILSQETRHLQVCIDGLYEHTNLKELEEETGQHILGKFGEEYCNKDGRDYVRKNREITYPITLSTYQALSSGKGKEALQKIKDAFGILWVEEAHHEIANSYHKVVRSFSSWYKLGATATPTRRDMLHVALYDAIGPVTATGLTQQMVPVVSWIHTGIEVPKWVFQKMYPISSLHSWLGGSDDYRQVVLKYVLKDIEDERKPLVISERRSFASYIHEQVKMSGFGSKLLMGGTKLSSQEPLIRDLLSGKTSCVVGTKVIKENVNIPPLDTIHLCFPNFGKEAEEQMIGRIRRYLKDDHGINTDLKKQPLIRVYTYVADHKIPTSAINFRKSLYKSWGFNTVNEIEDNPRIEVVRVEKAAKGLRREI